MCDSIVGQADPIDCNDCPAPSDWRAAVQTLADHACETYPHFESPRGQRDIAAVRALLQADPWHLFRVEISDADGTHGFMVSAQSGSEQKAQELAEAAALDVCGTDDAPGAVAHCSRVGTVDRDVFESFGLLAE